MRLFCKNSLTARSRATYISPTDGGGAVAASAASGLRDDLEKRSSLLGSGGRAVSVVSSLRLGCGIWVCAAIRAGRLAPGVAAGIYRGGAKAFLDCYLTITSEGRETWAAGSLRGFVVWVGLARAGRSGMAMGSEETTDGHVSKFIALGAIAGWNVERRTGLVVCWERMCLELVKNDRGLKRLLVE